LSDARYRFERGIDPRSTLERDSLCNSTNT